MRISIVTISYNQAHFLRECIDSVLSQDYPDIEYIIVDPGSTDGSREIIESYDDRVLKVFEGDAGAADGLNKGFAKVTGDIYGFLNSDDSLLPGTLKIIAKYFSRNSCVDVVSGCGYFSDEANKKLRRIIPSRLTPWLYAHGGVSVFQQGTFFRPKYFHAVGGFNAHNKTCWDGELFLDMAMAGARFATIGNDLALFRLHPGGITGSGRLEAAYREESERLFEKATGRKRNSSDWASDLVARLAKGVVDPAYVLRRLTSTPLTGRGK